MSLADHLRELRRRLIVSVAAVAIGCLVAYFLYNQILTFLVHPYCSIQHRSKGQSCSLLILDPINKLTFRLKISFFGGFILALPVVLWQTWRFITPGLHPREKRYAVPFVASSVALFAFCAFVALATLPLALRFFQSVGGSQLSTFYAADPYIRLVTLMVIVYGLGFEFPVVLVALLVARVLTTAKLRKWRRYAFVGVVSAAAIFTPSSDPISMFALAIPLYLFYEASILIGRALKR
jgi:sec-independent protein translocase protein TatC